MGDFPTALLQCSVSMSLVTLAYAAVLPLLSKRYAAKWRYPVWLVIAAGWIFPFRPRMELPFLPERISNAPLLPAQFVPIQPAMGDTAQAAAMGETAASSASVSLWTIAAVIWMAGVIFAAAYHVLRHRRFMKMVVRWGEPVTDSGSLGILDGLKSEMGMKARVGLSVCRSVTSPMLVGFFRPAVLLPPVKIADDELSLILKHELIHLKRHDLWHKALILAATVLHWFNPAVYLMAKAAAAQCEISCDALVLQGADFQRRKRYGEAVIGIAKSGAKLRTVLSTDFYGGKKGMKDRLSSIMDTSEKKAGFVILCVVLIAIMGTGMTLAVTDKEPSDSGETVGADNNNLTLEDFNKAKRINEIIGEPGWEDTNLFILAELPGEDITMYGMKDKGGIYGNVAIRSGEKINYYGWSYYAGKHDAEMGYRDYDNDGVKELAVNLYLGGGTGVSIDQLFMLEEIRPGIFEPVQFKSDDYIAQVENMVSYRVNEENKTVSFFRGETELQNADISRLKEDEKVENIFYGNIVRFDLNHGIVMGILPGMQINGWASLQYDGFSELEATVEYRSDGTFHITNIR